MLKTYKSPQNMSHEGYKIGDTISFTRQVVGYPKKKLTGKIVDFNQKSNIGTPKHYFPIALVKAECEYGSELKYNHSLALCELTKVN